MKSDKFYKISQVISDWLEANVASMLKTFLKTQYGGWFFGKIIDASVDLLSDKIVDPVTDVLVIRLSKKFDVERAKRMVERM